MVICLERGADYSPADAAAISKPHHLLPHLNPDWFYLSDNGIPRMSRKRSRQTGVVVSRQYKSIQIITTVHLWIRNKT